MQSTFMCPGEISLTNTTASHVIPRTRICPFINKNTDKCSQDMIYKNALPYSYPPQKAYVGHPCMRDCISWHKGLPAKKIKCKEMDIELQKADKE